MYFIGNIKYFDDKIDNDLINGSVDISGSYKMTQASILEEDFYYSLPFSIAISKKTLNKVPLAVALKRE